MKKILYLFLILGLLYFVLALFGPSEIKVERRIFLECNKAELKNVLSDFTLFHKYWNPMLEKDSGLKAEFKGQPGVIGHAYLWSGNQQSGNGELELMAIGLDSLHFRLNYSGKGTATSYFFLQDSAQGCLMTWGTLFPVNFLGRTPLLFVNMNRRIGGDYAIGLSKLKQHLNDAIAESSPVFEIKETNWEASTYIGRKQNLGFDEMEDFFDTQFGLLSLLLEREKIRPLSSPSGLIFTYDENQQRLDVGCAIKVPDGTFIKEWDTFSFPACKVLSVEYKGYPSGTGDAHKAMDTYMRSKGYRYQMVIEEYLKGPDENEECYGCITMIYYLLE